MNANANANAQEFRAHSPLDINSIRKIDQSNLSLLERHHVRLLAHCLECFKSMNSLNQEKSLPSKEDWLKWCLLQPILRDDDDFVQILVEQFSGAAYQLTQLSEKNNVAPLELTLDDLINAYQV